MWDQETGGEPYCMVFFFQACELFAFAEESHMRLPVLERPINNIKWLAGDLGSYK